MSARPGFSLARSLPADDDRRRKNVSPEGKAMAPNIKPPTDTGGNFSASGQGHERHGAAARMRCVAPLRVLLLAHSFNSLTQRVFVELQARGHVVSLELDIADAVTEEAVALFAPDVIVAPFLKRRIPESVWRRCPCLPPRRTPMTTRRLPVISTAFTLAAPLRSTQLPTMTRVGLPSTPIAMATSITPW